MLRIPCAMWSELSLGMVRGANGIPGKGAPTKICKVVSGSPRTVQRNLLNPKLCRSHLLYSITPPLNPIQALWLLSVKGCQALWACLTSRRKQREWSVQVEKKAAASRRWDLRLGELHSVPTFSGCPLRPEPSRCRPSWWWLDFDSGEIA